MSTIETYRALMQEAASMLHDSMFQFCDTSDRAHALSKRISAALRLTTPLVTCDECAGTGKCGPDEDPEEMDCEVCSGIGSTMPGAHNLSGNADDGA